MRERTNIASVEKRMLDATEVCAYLGLGRNRGIEFAKSIGAERKIGRRSLYDKRILDKALDEMTE